MTSVTYFLCLPAPTHPRTHTVRNAGSDSDQAYAHFTQIKLFFFFFLNTFFPSEFNLKVSFEPIRWHLVNSHPTRAVLLGKSGVQFQKGVISG